MDVQTQIQKLKSLKEVLGRFIKEEHTRLILEREFLSSVLNDSLGGPTQRSNTLDEEVAITDLLGD